MPLADLTSMFSLGILGTGHCLGMCGPLVLAVPARSGGFFTHILYHLGRITTYSAVGALLGGAGAGLAMVNSDASGLGRLVQIQILFSLLAAGIMLLFGLGRLGIIKEPEWMIAASPTKIPGFSRIRKAVLGQPSRGTIFVFGLMLGFLPCGLSYGAFARALAAGGPLFGGMLTAAFGLGTVPGLLSLGTGASGLMRRHRRLSDLLAGVLMIGMAVSLVLDLVPVVWETRG